MRWSVLDAVLGIGQERSVAGGGYEHLGKVDRKNRQRIESILERGGDGGRLPWVEWALNRAGSVASQDRDFGYRKRRKGT
jgi:hypothetical protein